MLASRLLLSLGALLCALAAPAAAKGPYTLTLATQPKTPVLSFANKKGQGHSACKFTFNPAWIPASDTFNGTGLLVRAAQCPTDFGGSNDHIMFANCTADGVCQDLQPGYQLENGSEDPRVFYHDGYYYNFYYAPGSGLDTVKLAKTKTPQDPSSWEHVTTLPWHRNGCVILRHSPPHYVLYGEGPDPLPGLGLATTTDFTNFTTINATFLLPLGEDKNEIKLEAGTHAVQLKTGDYLMFYAAATPGWVAHGNYTAGWIILDKNDPTKIVQRSDEHIMVPLLPYEQGIPPYPVNRANVIFLCSAVPTSDPNVFRLWFGAADASVGTATVKVDYQSHADSRL